MTLRPSYPRLENASLNGKRVLLRIDASKAFDSTGTIANKLAILSILPTIEFILNKGARIILLVSASQNSKLFEIHEIAPLLEKELKQKVEFVPDFLTKNAKIEIEKNTSPILVFESLNKFPQEAKNEKEFARTLASFGDIYVNEARSSNYLESASIVTLPTLLPSYLGIVLHRELEFLEQILQKNKQRPILILGGMDLEKKLDFLKRFLTYFKAILIGGGIGYTFLDSRAIPVGNSFKDVALGVPAFQLTEKAELELVKFLLPIDHIIANDLSPKAKTKTTTSIPKDWTGVDIGPKSLALFEKSLVDASSIFWYGTMGMTEIKNFNQGTQALVHILAKSKLPKFACGLDTTTSIYNSGKYKNFDFIEVDSDFTLKVLYKKKMPGIEVLLEKEDEE